MQQADSGRDTSSIVNYLLGVPNISDLFEEYTSKYRMHLIKLFTDTVGSEVFDTSSAFTYQSEKYVSFDDANTLSDMKVSTG